MGYWVKIRWVQAVVFFVAVGLSSFCALSVSNMNHNLAMVEDNPVLTRAISCGQGHEADQCIDFHLAAMHSLSQVAPGYSLDGHWAAYLLSALLLAYVFGSSESRSQRSRWMRVRWRQFYEKTVMVYFYQLGEWLLLFAKRDP